MKKCSRRSIHSGIRCMLMLVCSFQAMCTTPRSKTLVSVDGGGAIDDLAWGPLRDTPLDDADNRLVHDAANARTEAQLPDRSSTSSEVDGWNQDTRAKILTVANDASLDLPDMGEEVGAWDGPASFKPGLPHFILGADITITLEDEYWGATYSDGEKQKSIEQLLKDHGFNFIRINTLVNPGAPGGYAVGKPQPFRDLAHTQTLAKRIKKLGLGFLLDLHYSDTWTDPSHQTLPSTWTGLGRIGLETKVHDYTKDVLESLKSEGALPDIVQVGNEITNGMLWEWGRVVNSDFSNLAGLLKAGIRAVREVDPNIQILLHIEKCHHRATSEWWLDGVLGQGVRFDILGQSCYAAAPNGVAAYQGSPQDWQATFSALAIRYPTLKFMIAEYSAEQRAANDTMYGLPNGRGLGTFNWDPTRAYDTHPNHPLFATHGAWNKFVAIPELLSLYDQMASDYGLR